MEWYIPITIIPGIGLIIMSTSSNLIALNTEISQLNNEKNIYNEIIDLKLQQLRKLSIAMVLQYLSVILFLFSGIILAVSSSAIFLSKCLLLSGVSMATLAIIILFFYAIKSVSIRQKHLKCTK
ncbi:MAG: hypothetical protein N4A59_05800 [Marinifilum sp.]|jgi:hypothetical protein|nr:hypothetical protein [Marinifilum sp.]